MKSKLLRTVLLISTLATLGGCASYGYYPPNRVAPYGGQWGECPAGYHLGPQGGWCWLN